MPDVDYTPDWSTQLTTPLICLQLWPWQLYMTKYTQRNTGGFPNPSTQKSILQGIQLISPKDLYFLVSGASGVSTQVRSWLVPGGFWSTLMLTASPQFSQVQVVQDTSTGGANINRCGLGVLCSQYEGPNGQGGSGYYLEIRGDTLQMELYRDLGTGGNGGGGTSLIAPGGSMVFAMNDTIRLEVTIQAGVSNTVTVKRNGVQVGQVVDSNAGRPVRGLPGLAYSYESSNLYYTVFRAFTAGGTTAAC